MLQIKARTKILALFCAMSFLMYVDRVNLSATAGLIKDELGLSNTELGVIFSAFAYTYAVFQIIGGWFVDRLGSRRMIIFCGIIWVIATMATGFVGGFISLFLARLLLGRGRCGAAFSGASDHLLVQAAAAWLCSGRYALILSFGKCDYSPHYCCISGILVLAWRIYQFGYCHIYLVNILDHIV